jgi:hypothetical protein
VGLSHERSDIAGAEGFHSLEGNMCGTAWAREMQNAKNSRSAPNSPMAARRADEVIE